MALLPAQGVQMNPLTWAKIYIYIYIIFNFFLPPKIKFELPEHKFCLNLAEIGLNMLNLVLLSQYFHNNFKINVKGQVIIDFI